MVFEACRMAQEQPPYFQIREQTLHLAIDHVEEFLRAAGYLDSLANRSFISNQAEAILARIRTDSLHNNGNAICLTRTQLTTKFAPNPGRRGAITPEHLYSHIIPMLIAQGNATRLRKNGKMELYAFRPEDQGLA